MSDSQTPTDPQQLRAEIEQKRAELGDTVQQLAAKADVKARAKQAVGDAAGKARQKLAGVKDQTAQAVGTVKEKAGTAQQQLADSDLPAPIRKPLPLAAIAAATAAVIVAFVVLIRRRRS
jgi:serine/threonine protein kinase HipA of HipAB toxin-antitoxin module